MSWDSVALIIFYGSISLLALLVANLLLEITLSALRWVVQKCR